MRVSVLALLLNRSSSAVLYTDAFSSRHIDMNCNTLSTHISVYL